MSGFMLQKLHALNGTNIFSSRALTEKIVAVLPKMKCPHRIEPHQIQGLDFIHIYPVVQVNKMTVLQIT